MNDINEYRSRHLAFWNMEDTQRPLLGFTVGAGADSWSYWKYNKAAEKIFQNQNILPEYISPEDFVDDQVKYLEDSAKIDDDQIVILEVFNHILLDFFRTHFRFQIVGRHILG